MHLKNDYGKTVDWKVFNADDKAFMFGIAEGTVAAGATAEFTPPDGRNIRIAIKIGLEQIVDPSSEWFAAGADLVLKGDRKIVDAFTEQDLGTKELTFESWDITDARDWTTDEKRTLTTSMSTAVETSRSTSTSHAQTTTWGLKTTTSASEELSQPGVKATSNVTISGSFESKVEEKLTSMSTTSVKQTKNEVVEREMTIEAGHVAYLHTSWVVTVQLGRLTGPDGQVVDYSTIVKVGESKKSDGQYSSAQILGSEKPTPPFQVLAALAETAVHAGHGTTATATAIFRYKAPDTWTEEPAVMGGAHFEFKETKREGTGIELFDAGRDVTLVLDLGTRKVMYRSGGDPLVPLYEIMKIGQ